MRVRCMLLALLAMLAITGAVRGAFAAVVWPLSG